ncbi:tubulin nucleotide-binding domain-like protein [Phialemonium atrogriseum]|uniref:Tubulin nucleotide-binding domain-like protein n=1 Tax=Phialemonium atrogriseum TaxID=1093897 RepID=A0AAJ0C2Z7_9PEZI|nr:tubulin nucleotide-binding domain-like protein [Phialemonium atrogriseum]KAK1769208.1 tubulin nucleotide-binding domain-like protein [Phialemonium atrogriseum]
MHEIITVQLGQQSNYLATHFWNAQESYFTYSGDQEPLVDHDVLWRAGLGADGSETFMPRTVVYDLKGGFGSLRKINALYEVEDKGSDQALWHQPVVVQKQEPIPQSAYQQSLDAGLEPPELTTSTVRYWSDFNRVFFHPRSIIQLNDYELNSSLVPFEKWATGQELFSTLDKEHDLVDRDLRPFIEEADHMQGIQLMATLDDAWGGFASDYIERLRDEYGKTAIWVWVLQDSFHGIPRDKRLVRLANKAKSLTELYKNASIIVPITLPRLLGSHVALDPSSHWHTSAVVAAALESATLPSRLKDRENRDTLGGMADLLNTMGNQSIANLQMSIDPQTTQDSPDVRMREAVSGEDAESEGLHLDLDFSPSDQLESRRPLNGFRKPRIFSQLVTRRGQGVDDDANEDEAAEDERFRRRNPNKPTNRRYKTSLPFPLINSFPKIFKDDDGNPLKGAVDVTTSLTTDTAVSDRLKLLRTTVARSISLEDREALSNDLAGMAEEYHEGWSSGSDEGVDD